MSLNFAALANAPRLLMEAYLKPLQGTRFRPTNFPNLGSADYDAPDPEDNQRVKRMLLVESAASVSNWLERALFKDFTRDTVSEDLIDQANGIPYVKIDCGQFGQTSTLLEAHRLNTPYLWESSAADAMALQTAITEAIGVKRRKKKGETGGEGDAEEAAGRIDMGRFYRALMKFDTNSLIHGIFLEKLSGRLRVPRALSGFVEAQGVARAESGGTKFDHILPAKDEKGGITSKDGYTNVPYPTTDFVAEDIVAYFHLDLSQIRGYRLGREAEQLLIGLAIYKLARFSEVGAVWDLRSPCKLEVIARSFKRPIEGFEFPEKASDVACELPNLISAVANVGLFDPERVRTVHWTRKRGTFTIELPKGTAEPAIPDDLKEAVKWKKETKKNAPSLTLGEHPTKEMIGRLVDLFQSDSEKQAVRESVKATENEEQTSENVGEG